MFSLGKNELQQKNGISELITVVTRIARVSVNTLLCFLRANLKTLMKHGKTQTVKSDQTFWDRHEQTNSYGISNEHLCLFFCCALVLKGIYFNLVTCSLVEHAYRHLSLNL